MIKNIKDALKNYFEDEKQINPAGTPGFETGYPERDVNWMKSNLIPRIENIIDKNVHKNCLDVGCAFGYFSKVLSETFEKTYGIDLSDNRINYAKQLESDNLKFVQSDLTESFKDKFPIKFDFMFTNAVLPHIPLEFKSDVFKNLAEVANSGCIFVMYDGMLDDDGRHKHDKNTQANFENWSGKEIIRVVFISEKWIRENATDWEIVEITNIGHATEEIILKRK
jgi:2-polyprenyl-3-methyl-5-hydroxy-6-metoxy-1,4-benzoquinol methylase